MLRRFVLFVMTRLATLVPAIPGAVLARIVAGLCAGLTCLASTADLKISIQAPPWDQPQPLWQRLTYTIIVSNAGPDTATQVVVTNQVREQFSDPVIIASQGVWTLTNRSLRCDLGELASGSVASVAVEATPTNSAGILLDAGVTSFNFDPTWSNTTYTQIELGVANVQVQIEVKTNRVFAGVPFPLTITVTNLGPDPAEYVPLYSSSSVTQRCSLRECRYWPDFVGAGYSLSQGEVAEFHDDGIPWHVNLGKIPSRDFATLDLTLVPTRTGDLPFSYSARRNDRDTNYGSINISVSPGPGIIEFSAPETNVWEDAGVARLEVRRRDGAEGSIEVPFSTRDGTAVAGQDYVGTSGTLTFAPGETTKEITVLILSNERGECNRDLTLTLSHPTGGAFLYGATNATVFILDDDLRPSGSLQPVAVPSNGFETGLGDTAFSSVSADGRWLAFSSLVPDLVPNDTNGTTDVFLKDLLTGEIRLVSVSRLGNHSGNGSSWLPVITPDGRYVAFESSASDLVTNTVPDSRWQVFVRDVLLGTTRLVSVTEDATGADTGVALSFNYLIMGISTNGQVVAFLNDGLKLADGRPQLFVRNLATETTKLITLKYDGSGPSNGDTYEASLSADGRYIAFACSASDLVAGFGHHWDSAIYLHDLVEGRTTPVYGGGLVPHGSPLITPDGRYIVFRSGHPEYQILIHDRPNNTTRRASEAAPSPCDSPSISANGRFVVFRGGAAGFTNSSSQIYVYDSWSNSTALVSVNCHGTGSANSGCRNPTISADGRYVFLESYATDLAPGEFWQIPPSRESGLNLFRRDLQGGTTLLITQNRSLSGGGSWNSGLATQRGEFNLTPDGSLAIVSSLSDDLVYEDNNGFIDLFVWRADGQRDNRPRLAISRENSELAVRWPRGATNFVLQSATDLSGSTWTNLPLSPSNTVFRVQQPIGRAFFRLEQRR